MKIIRYGKNEKVIADCINDVNENGSYSIRVSLNPLLYNEGYFPMDMVGEKGCNAILLDFDDLVRESSKVIIFNYYQDISFSLNNFEIVKYPHAECAYEMEIRFLFDF